LSNKFYRHPPQQTDTNLSRDEKAILGGRQATALSNGSDGFGRALCRFHERLSTLPPARRRQGRHLEDIYRLHVCAVNVNFAARADASDMAIASGMIS
jgi:hypothetical protein